MFITTPVVRVLVKHLHKTGKIDEDHCEQLIQQEKQFSAVILVASLLLLASFFL
jgi:mannitol/fructose-specific phosphotransferase system IIA component